MRSLVLLLLATACGSSENAIAEQQGGGDDSGYTGVVDEDGDGYTDDDCDESSTTVNPGAAEVCDGVDNNCDGQIDEEQDDGDSDGICDSLDECPDDPSNTCNTDPVYAENTTCDGVDNDGDGTEGTPTDLVIDVSPGNGECVVNTSEMFSEAGQHTVQVCDEGAYVACNATDSSASITAVAGVFYPDGCAQALSTNPSWDPIATTCGWVVPE